MHNKFLSYQKEIMCNSLNVFEWLKRHFRDTIFGAILPIFPESEANKHLRVEAFLYLCHLKLCQTVILDYCCSIVECQII